MREAERLQLMGANWHIFFWQGWKRARVLAVKTVDSSPAVSYTLELFGCPTPMYRDSD
jgi:hypothetical protein